MKSSLLVLGVAVTVIPALAMFAFIGVMGKDIVKTASQQFRLAALDCARQSTIDIRQMCEAIEVSDDIANIAIRENIEAEISKLGTPSVNKDPVQFQIFQENFPKKKKFVYAPLIRFGNNPIKIERNKLGDIVENDIQKILIDLKAKLHCELSLFSNIENTSNFVRVATTLMTSSGFSMIGSYVSADDDSAIGYLLREMMKTKKMVSGLVNLTDKNIVANYLPILDGDSNIIGIFFFGSEMTAIDKLEKILRTLTIGQTGSVWIIDDSNPNKPILKVSKATDSKMSINDSYSDSGQEFIKQIIEKSRAIKYGNIEVERIRTSSKNNDGYSYSERFITYTYYEPWRWVIGASFDSDEFSKSEKALLKQIQTSSEKIIYAGLFFTLIAIGVAWVLSYQLSRPFKVLKKVAGFHSKGDMQSAENILAKFKASGGYKIKEFDKLTNAISEMTITLSNLLNSIRNDGEDVSNGSIKISELAKDLELISIEEVASMQRVADSSKSISIASNDINKAAKRSAFQLENTLEISREGGDNLQLLKRNYDALYLASENVMQKLSNINDNADKITEIVTTISEINKQTNLLSLNASIEAEKAGEVGLGFALVARQIRLLADVTSKAAFDIDSAVNQMQSAVNSGVMEMDKFGANMLQSLKFILDTADSLSKVVGDIEQIKPKFENISGRISMLSTNANKISQTMNNLSSSSIKGRNTVLEFKSATKTLNSTKKSLIEGVAEFKIMPRKERK